MFVKNPISYPGNKNRIVNQLIPLFPKDYSIFVDVFCGSGVVAVNSLSKTIVCNDISKHTLEVLDYFYNNSFETVVFNIEKIINNYGLTYSRIMEKGTYVEEKHEGLSRYNKNGFLRLKCDYNNDKSIEKLIVLLIYGFNHYIRFNNNDEYNVPVGKVDFSASIYNNLKLFMEELKKKELYLLNEDFENTKLYEFEDALYYFDPPYLITTAPYNISWTIEDEKRLLKLLDRLNSEGKKFALSNVILSNGKKNELLIEWSKKYKTNVLKRQYRNANYQKKNITESIEVLITNF